MVKTQIIIFAVFLTVVLVLNNPWRAVLNADAQEQFDSFLDHHPSSIELKAFLKNNIEATEIQELDHCGKKDPSCSNRSIIVQFPFGKSSYLCNHAMVSYTLLLDDQKDVVRFQKQLNQSCL